MSGFGLYHLYKSLSRRGAARHCEALRGTALRGKARQEHQKSKQGRDKMKKLTVKIVGATPLLMHAYRGTEPSELRNSTPQEQAEYHVYRDNKTQELYIPVENIQRALISGAAYSKGKGRASLQKSVAAGLLIEDLKLPLGTKEYTIDTRGVVIPATKGRIERHRARLDTWSTSFTAMYDEVLLSEKQVKQIIADTGTLVGLGDFRPEKKGPYGRFNVEF